MSEETQICPKCNRTIPPDAPGGMCPYCAFEEALSVKGPGKGGDVSDWEEDLLLGLYVFLLRYVSSSEFSIGVKSWLADPARPLASHLEQRGALTPEKRAFAERLVLQTLGYCDGDMEEAFRLLGGRGRIAHMLSVLDEETAQELTTRIAIDLEGFDTSPIEDLFAHREELGRYTRSTEHSRGGMGRIFIVHDELLIRDVALKELLPLSESSAGRTPEDSPIRGSGELLARFLKEARITGRLEHPTIVPVYELGRRPSGAPYYTMRLVRGKTLSTALDDCATLEERLRYLPNFVDLCMGIAYAHSKNIIHRDIKPTNVMVGEFGETVIIDWGLAKLIGERDESKEAQLQTLAAMRKISKEAPVAETREGLQIGTPAYMSPEQAAGRIPEIDARSDIFSLGIVLYRILTGQLPFQGKTAEETMALIQIGNPAPPNKLEPHVPRELASICMKALAVDKDKRYVTAQKFAEDIRSFLSGSLVGAYNYSPRERFLRYYRRNRGIFNTVAAALILLLATGAVSYYNVHQARNDALVARDAARYNEYLAEIRLAQSYLRDNDYPTAREILWSTQPELRNWEWGYLTAVTHQELYSVDGPSFMNLSADGSILATYGGSESLTFRRPVDGAPIAESGGLVRTIRWAEFRPNSNIFTAALTTGAVRSWNATTGDVLWTISVSQQGVDVVRYSGDGSRFVSMAETGEVIVWDYTEEFPRELTRFPALEVGSINLTPETREVSAYEFRAQLNETGDLLLLALRESLTGVGQFDLYALRPTGPERLASEQGYFPRFQLGAAEVAAAVGSTVFRFPLDNSNLGAPQVLGQHSQPVNHLVVSPDGAKLVSLSQDGTALIHHLDEQRAATSLIPAPGSSPLRLAAFNLDGTLLAAATHNHRIQLWDVATGNFLNEFRGHWNAVTNIASVPARNILIASAWGASVKAWVASDVLGQQVVYRTAGAIADLAVDGAGTVMAAAAPGARVEVLNLPRHEARLSMAAFDAFDTPEVDVAENGARIVAVLDGFLPVTLDIDSRSILADFRGHAAEVTDADIAPDGERVLTSSSDGVAIVWEATTGAELLRLDGHRHGPMFAAFQPLTQNIVTAGYDGQIRYWDRDGRSLVTVNGDHPAEALAFSDDGKIVFATFADGPIGVWDLTTGERLTNLEGHTETLATMPGTSRLLSGNASGVIHVWDPYMGVLVASFQEHAYGSIALAAMSDGRTVYSGGQEGIVRRWESLPYRGSEAVSSPADLARFQASVEERAAVGSTSTDPAVELVLTTETRLRDDLQALRAILANEPAEAFTQGVPLVSGTSWNAVARLMLLPLDRIIAIQGQQISGKDEALAALDSAIDALAAPGAVIQMSNERRGLTTNVQFILLPITETTLDVEMQHDELQESLTRFRDNIRRYAGNVHELSQRYATAAGKPLADVRDLDGLVISYRLENDDAERFARLGLTYPDRMVAVDAEPVTNVDQLIDHFSDALDQLEAGEFESLTLQVERGQFKRFVVRVTT